MGMHQYNEVRDWLRLADFDECVIDALECKANEQWAQTEIRHHLERALQKVLRAMTKASGGKWSKADEVVGCLPCRIKNKELRDMTRNLEHISIYISDWSSDFTFLKDEWDYDFYIGVKEIYYKLRDDFEKWLITNNVEEE